MRVDSLGGTSAIIMRVEFRARAREREKRSMCVICGWEVVVVRRLWFGASEDEKSRVGRLIDLGVLWSSLGG